MKIIVGKQQFKSVTESQAKANPVLADRVGKRREMVSFDLPAYEVEDLAELVSSPDSAKLLVTCLNAAIADLAKAKFAANGTDWSYVPVAETDLSLTALAASFESSTRSRVLSNESAGRLVSWIKANAAELVAGIQAVDASYTSTQLVSICVALASYSVYAAKDASILAKVVLRLEQISEAIGSSDTLAMSFVEDSSLADVFDALVKKFSRSNEEEITADAL